MSSPVKIPVVDEVRRAREEIAKECDYDLRKLLDMLKSQEKASGRPVHTPGDRGKA